MAEPRWNLGTLAVVRYAGNLLIAVVTHWLLARFAVEVDIGLLFVGACLVDISVEQYQKNGK